MTLSARSPSVHCNLTSWEPWLGTPKATSITEYPLQDREDRLLTINLHAVNFALGLEDFQAQLHALTDVLASHQGPVILAGDLNTWSEHASAGRRVHAPAWSGLGVTLNPTCAPPPSAAPWITSMCAACRRSMPGSSRSPAPTTIPCACG